jgi:hypothetical protein
VLRNWVPTIKTAAAAAATLMIRIILTVVPFRRLMMLFVDAKDAAARTQTAVSLSMCCELCKKGEKETMQQRTRIKHAWVTAHHAKE